MTKNVIPFAGHRAGHQVHTSAPTPPPAQAPLPDNQATAIARHQAIENALSLALYWIRRAESPSNIHLATARAVRAGALLKQACADLATDRAAAAMLEQCHADRAAAAMLAYGGPVHVATVTGRA